MQGYSLTASDLACRRGDRLLLRGLSFALASGDALQLTGANGIGKSSVLRICAGLLQPFSGRIEREGAVGLVDERPALDPRQPLAAALGFWRRMDGCATGEADEHLVRLGIAALGEVPVGYLSTGQKKRAAFARLMAQDAPIWLLDEPLNGLDGEGHALIETLTAEHCERGGIALIASHQSFALPGLRRLDLADFAA